MTAKEMLNKRKFNPDEPITLYESEVEDLMNEFARHIAERAMEEEMKEWGNTFERPFKHLLTRINELTEVE